MKLLAILTQHANPRGLTLISQHKLLGELNVPLSTVRRELVGLEESGAIEVLSPLPFLVARLRMWSDEEARPAHSKPQTRPSRAPSHIEVPVSGSFAAAALQAEVGGAGEGDPLLEEALAVLGPEADAGELRVMLQEFSPGLVRRCLRRVVATRHIRVSKTALFRSLLTKLSH